MRENIRRNNHQYKVGDKILVKRKKNSKHELEFMGPLPITQINDNGKVCFQKEMINDATKVHHGELWGIVEAEISVNQL